MSWDQDFINQLNASQWTPAYLLRFLDLENNVGERFEIATFAKGSSRLSIGRAGVKVQGTRVIPGRWSSSFGGFSVEVVGDPRGDFYDKVCKGSFAELFCSVNGSPFNRIAMGQLQGMTRYGFEERYTLNFKDLVSAFQMTTNTDVGSVPTPVSTDPPQFPLFWQTGIKTTLSSAWLLGDASMSVLDNSNFRKGSTQNGIIKVYKNSDPSTFYFLEIAAIGTNTFDTSPYGIQVYPSTNLAFMLPTSGGGASAVSCARLDGHPCDIIGYLLTSTGFGTNGSHDIYPVEWSIGGGFTSNIYDAADAANQKQVIRGDSSTAYSWRLVYDSPLADGLRSIMNTAAQCGSVGSYETRINFMARCNATRRKGHELCTCCC